MEKKSKINVLCNDVKKCKNNNHMTKSKLLSICIISKSSQKHGRIFHTRDEF